MKNLHAKLLTIALSALFLGACASEPTAKDFATVKVKTEGEAHVKTNSDLQTEGDKLIETANLTNEQKEKLRTLRTDLRGKLASFTEKSLQLRALLLKEVLTNEYNRKEVLAIEKDLRKNSEARLDVIFNSVKTANQIIGRTSDRKQLLEDMMEFENAQNRRDQ